MERSRSSGRQNGRHQVHEYSRDSIPRPPWEQRKPAQIPYVGPNSSQLTEAQWRALSSLRATHENGSRENNRTHANSNENRYGSHGPSYSPANSWSRNPPMPAPVSAPTSLPPIQIPQGSPSVVALPGTMSAREKSPSRARSRSRTGGSQRFDGFKKERPESGNFKNRFKHAIKDAFRSDPMDGDNFERIEGRHWTDD